MFTAGECRRPVLLTKRFHHFFRHQLIALVIEVYPIGGEYIPVLVFGIIGQVIVEEGLAQVY